MAEAETTSKWAFSVLGDLHALFGWEEYLVLSILLLVSLAIGGYFAWRGQRSTSEFLMASKEMTLFPMTMSLACRYEK